MQGQVVCYASQ
jgi:hypothetical protein